MNPPTDNYDMVHKEGTFSFLHVDPFPFTNADLDDPLNMLSINGDDDYNPSPCFTKKALGKAERRAEHNAIERARREILNNKFQRLAQALPNMMNYRRPSKGQIVGKALEWVTGSIPREERYRYQLIQLQNENKKLLAQLTQSPTASDSIALPLPSPSASLLAPTPSHRQRYTYDSHVFQQQQQQQQQYWDHHLHRNPPHPSVSTTSGSLSSFFVPHHLSNFTTSSSSTTTALTTGLSTGLPSTFSL